MAQIQKAEGQIELKCHADRFFNIWARNTDQISKMCPHWYPKIELHEGDWDKDSCVATWHYVLPGGKSEFLKTIIEVDENKKSVTYNYLDGPIVKNYYKSIKSMIKVIPMGENCIVKWRIDYEKMNEDAPPADIYVGLLLYVAKEIDALLCNA